MDADLISHSLGLVADKCPDPAPLVYARLFATAPELQSLFVRDTSGLVRGQMLSVLLESLLDFVGDRTYGAALIRIERVNHEGLGVPPDTFDTFFRVVRDVFREIGAEDWTPSIDKAWDDMLAEIADAVKA